jgi:hypothetical protein
MTGDRQPDRTIWVQRVIVVGCCIAYYSNRLACNSLDPTYGTEGSEDHARLRDVCGIRAGIDRRIAPGHLMVHIYPVYDLKVTYNQVPQKY